MLATSLLIASACKGGAKDTDKEHLLWVKEAGSASSFINDATLIGNAKQEEVAAHLQLFQVLVEARDFDFDRVSLVSHHTRKWQRKNKTKPERTG